MSVARRRFVALAVLHFACAPRSSTTDAAPVVETPKPAEPATPSEPTATPDPATPSATSDEAALPAAPTFTSGAFEIRFRNGKLLAPTKAFKRKGGTPDMQEHATKFGWAEDGSVFVFCEMVSGEDCNLCTLATPDGKIEKLVSGSMCAADGATKMKRKELDARVASLKIAVRDGTWAHGGDLVVTMDEKTGKSDSSGQPRAILEVGTAVRTGTGSGTAFDESACLRGKDGEECFADAHADAVLPSPDGDTIAILAHMWAGEWSDTFTLAVLPAGRVAAAAYNGKGLDALRKNDFTVAAEAFVAATHADATAWKGPYNLACAYARGGDARSQAALRLAIDRGGDAVRTKARRDADLESVRATEWFVASVGAAK